ncbi:hypothetical protein N9M10_05240, partial [Hellea sp.]|nr:hypothetical protein [Hellea sp.]
YSSGVLTSTNGTISVTGGGLTNLDDVPDDADTNNTADDVLSIAGIVSNTTTSLTVTSGDIVLSTPVTSTAGLNLTTLD